MGKEIDGNGSIADLFVSFFVAPSHPRRSEKTSQRPLATGRDSELPSNSPSRTVRPLFPSFPVRALWSSRL